MAPFTNAPSDLRQSLPQTPQAIDLEPHGSSSMSIMSASSSSEAPSTVPPAYTGPARSYYHNEKASWHLTAIDSRTSSPPLYYPEAPFYPSESKDEPEPATLAELYFKYGFIFPVLWIAGAWILRSKLRIDPSLPWLPEKTEGEKIIIYHRMRSVEVKWARRCLWALMTFIVLTIVVLAITIPLCLVKRQ